MAATAAEAKAPSDPVEEAGLESFPASAPPARTLAPPQPVPSPNRVRRCKGPDAGATPTVRPGALS